MGPETLPKFTAYPVHKSAGENQLDWLGRAKNSVPDMNPIIFVQCFHFGNQEAAFGPTAAQEGKAKGKQIQNLESLKKYIH